MSLAAKLPYDHPYAGGFSGIGSQQLPTDSDCLTYLAAVKAADGAGVEVSVATAVDEFFRDTKAAGVFDALKACCILCGARTLSGALVPLVGAAPSNNNFVSADYTRGGATPGLKGDGSTKYLDSSRPDNSDSRNDNHLSVFITTNQTLNDRVFIGSAPFGTTGAHQIFFRTSTSELWLQPRNSGTLVSKSGTTYPTFVGYSRMAFDALEFRASQVSSTEATTSQTPSSNNTCVFSREDGNALTDGRLAFYSIGEALDLEALDDAVSTLVTAIGAAV
jgi:hypothetical protein